MTTAQRIVLNDAFLNLGRTKSGRYGWRTSTLKVLEKLGLVKPTWAGAFDAGWELTEQGWQVAKEQSTSKVHLSEPTNNAIAKHGEECCRKAYELNMQGEGASTIQYYLGFKCFAAANAAINAGRELVTGKR